MRTVMTSVIIFLLVSTTTMAQDVPQQDNAWFKAGQATIQEKLARQAITNRARNIILFIGGGNDVATNYATRLWHGQSQGNYGDENILPHEAFPYLALVKTYNTNAQTPDPAGTATALLTGVKTKAGVIGVDETVVRGDCASLPTSTITSIAEILAQAGRSVGIVTTARLTHATPAALYAHTPDRQFEDDAAQTPDCAVPDIAAQLIEQMNNGVIDIAMGGGRRHFLPQDTTGDEGHAGTRGDGRHLIDEAKALGVNYLWDLETFTSLGQDKQAATAVLGLFESSHMQCELDRSDEPSLAEMTRASIKAMKGNKNGYFLLVDGNGSHHANHASSLERAMTDGVAFTEAVAVANELTNTEDTLIIVTADHGQALVINGECGRGTPVTGPCLEVDRAGEKHLDEPVTADDGKSYDVATYSAGEDNRSGADVAAYARGPWAHLVDGTVEQSFLFHVMHHAAFAE